MCGLNWRCCGISLHRRNRRILVASCCGISSCIFSSWCRCLSVSLSRREGSDTSAWRGRSSARNGVVQRRTRETVLPQRGSPPTANEWRGRLREYGTQTLDSGDVVSLHRRHYGQRWPRAAAAAAILTIRSPLANWRSVSSRKLNRSPSLATAQPEK